MNLLKRIEVDFIHEDNRGSLTQLVHGGFSQINVLFTKANCSRGCHYHKEATERFYVIEGSVLVSAELNGIKEEVVFKKGELFEISPLIIHSMFFYEDCIMVAMYDIPVEKENGMKDIFSN